LSEQLKHYVRQREEGHTKDFLFAAMTNRVDASTVLDADLRMFATKRPLVPVSWLKREASGTTTNKAGQVAWQSVSTSFVDGQTVTNESAHIPKVDEVCRWVSYTVVDGEIGWKYVLKYNADGSLDYVHDSKCDGKEYDPKYEKVIADVEAEVTAEMKRNGTFGKFGSLHTAWRLKKNKLKAKGVEWRSPAELNPGRIYH